MTKPTIALTELVEKGADDDLLKQMIQIVAQRMMEFDVESLCGAGFDDCCLSGSAEVDPKHSFSMKNIVSALVDG